MLLGILGATAFPPLYFWPVLFVVFIPMLRMTSRAKNSGKAFGLGFIFAFSFFFCTLHWLVPTMQTFGPLPLPTAFGALALFAAYLALYPAFFFTFARSLHLRKAPLFFLLPAIWTGLELLRSFLFTGFPWAQLGHGLVAAPLLIQTADLGGVYLLSFGIMLVNTVLAFYPKKKGALFLACLCWILAILYGTCRIRQTELAMDKAETLAVSILQGNVPPLEKWEPSFQRKALETYQKLVEETPKEEKQLFLWPETALPFFLFEARLPTKNVLAMIRESTGHHLVGSLAYAKDDESLLNASYLISPEEKILGQYSKNHLVPFGEYIPLRKYFPFLSRLTGMHTEFLKGKGIPALSFDDVTLGTLICFESVFPKYSQKAVENGADLLAVQTNDAWFGTTGGPEQHLAFSRFRAVEFRRSVIRSANTGISAIILPTGKFLEKSSMNTPCSLHGDVPLFKKRTFYARTGNLFAWLCLLASLFHFLYSLKRNRKTVPENHSNPTQ